MGNQARPRARTRKLCNNHRFEHNNSLYFIIVISYNSLIFITNKIYRHLPL